jgi:hypothetical protein
MRKRNLLKPGNDSFDVLFLCELPTDRPTYECEPQTTLLRSIIDTLPSLSKNSTTLYKHKITTKIHRLTMKTSLTLLYRRAALVTRTSPHCTTFVKCLSSKLPLPPEEYVDGHLKSDHLEYLGSLLRGSERR